MDLKALARIGKGTKRKKRDVNLLDVAEDIKSLYSEQRSLKKAAKIAKLSPEMTRQFLSITKLEQEVKDLIRLKKITSVDMGYRISKLKKGDQVILARHVVDKSLSSDDVRLIVKYKMDNPKVPTENAVNKIIESKDKKIYVAYLGIEKHTFEKLLQKVKNKDRTKVVRSIFSGVVPQEFIVRFELSGRVVMLKVLKEGLQAMRNTAKKFGVVLAKLAEALVADYMEKK